MKIDWFTFVAQLINFVVLLWLLKTFLFGRIVEAMQKREDAIKERLAEADRLREEAQSEGEAFRKRSKELDSEVESILAKAKEQAAEIKGELVSKARDTANAERERWVEELERDKVELMNRFRTEVGRQVTSTAQKVVLALTDTKMEEQLIRCLVAKLESLPSEQKQALDAAVHAEGDQIHVHSSFELGESAKGLLTEKLQNLLDASAQIQFESLPVESLGVEVRTNSLSIPWTMKHLLEDVEERLSHSLIQRSKQHA